LGQIGTAEAVASLQKRRLVETDAGVNEEIDAALEAVRNERSKSSADDIDMRSSHARSTSRSA
jgi:hypothetical protein